MSRARDSLQRVRLGNAPNAFAARCASARDSRQSTWKKYSMFALTSRACAASAGRLAAHSRPAMARSMSASADLLDGVRAQARVRGRGPGLERLTCVVRSRFVRVRIEAADARRTRPGAVASCGPVSVSRTREPRGTSSAAISMPVPRDCSPLRPGRRVVRAITASFTFTSVSCSSTTATMTEFPSTAISRSAKSTLCLALERHLLHRGACAVRSRGARSAISQEGDRRHRKPVTGLIHVVFRASLTAQSLDRSRCPCTSTKSLR